MLMLRTFGSKRVSTMLCNVRGRLCVRLATRMFVKSIAMKLRYESLQNFFFFIIIDYCHWWYFCCVMYNCVNSWTIRKCRATSNRCAKRRASLHSNNWNTTCWRMWVCVVIGCIDLIITVVLCICSTTWFIARCVSKAGTCFYTNSVCTRPTN